MGRLSKGITMGIQHAERGIAIMRIVVGFWFLKAGHDHLAWTPLPWASARWQEVMPQIVAGHAAKNPIAFVKAFLEEVVVPNAHLFSGLSSLGEFAVGVSLTFGLLSMLGAIGGLFLVSIYGLMTIYSTPSQGFHLVLLAAMVVFLVTRPGRLWGVDSILARVNPRMPIW
jgi:uncharacterized membrane protein YphA (DoxX/SURF4 family)